MYGSSSSSPATAASARKLGLETRVPVEGGGGGGGLLRYRSAPSSLLGEVCEDLLHHPPARPPPASPPEALLARFLQSTTKHHHRLDGPPPEIAGGRRVEGSGGGGAGFAAAGGGHHLPAQMFYGASSGSLARQNSSPAGLFSSFMDVDNDMMRGMSGGGVTAGRLGRRISFSSSRQGSVMSQIPEMDASSPEENSSGDGGEAGYMGGYPAASWDDHQLIGDGGFAAPKQSRRGVGGDADCKRIAGMDQTEAQANQFGLLQSSSAEVAAMEKLLQFQDAVPCKIRAKRGCATHPRSIAERVRRTRISERMRKLQELVPNMDKQTNTADMLGLAVEYIKELQKQAKALSDDRVACTCSSGKREAFNARA